VELVLMRAEEGGRRVKEVDNRTVSLLHAVKRFGHADV
jgi:hypothetical protein